MTQICTEPRSYGQVTVSAYQPVELTPATRPSCKFQLQRATYQWTPPVDLQDEFHPEFSITFDAYIDEDGVRRFLPVGDVEHFIDNAFVAGLALLSRDRGLSWEERSCNRAMKLIFERVRGMQEHLEREFNYSRDLFIRERGRATDSERSVLPQRLCGAEPAWSPSRLREEGRLRARAAEVEEISTSVEISYGLLAAAEQDPLQIEDPEKVKSLMRMALFSPAQDDEPLTAECVEDVYGRLTDLFNAHRSDAEVDFQDWFRGPKSNLFKAIGGKTWKAPVVRKAMLQLGWQAYEYVSSCINFFVQAFMREVPERLTTDERVQFSRMYQPQPELGGLPVILLLERHQLIKPVIARYWTDPTDAAVIPVLHQLLAYYAEMADQRRAADRRSKSRQQHLEVAHSPLTENHSTVCGPPAEESPIEQMLSVLARRREWCCGLCEAPPTCAWGEGLQHSVVVIYGCAEHGNHREVAIPFAELRSIAKELDIEGPD